MCGIIAVSPFQLRPLFEKTVEGLANEQHEEWRHSLFRRSTKIIINDGDVIKLVELVHLLPEFKTPI